jgi:REP element-mobilizing transposase RayT
VVPGKYRNVVITEEVGASLVQICQEVSARYEIHFVDIGYEGDPVHFLIQSVPNESVSQLIRTVKSITAKELFRRHPDLKARLWGGNFWTSGYDANTVGRYGNQEVIRKYIENQGHKEQYIKLHEDQLRLFG